MTVLHRSVDPSNDYFAVTFQSSKPETSKQQYLSVSITYFDQHETYMHLFTIIVITKIKTTLGSLSVSITYFDQHETDMHFFTIIAIRFN